MSVREKCVCVALGAVTACVVALAVVGAESLRRHL
jgi:hypothetical protein